MPGWLVFILMLPVVFGAWHGGRRYELGRLERWARNHERLVRNGHR